MPRGFGKRGVVVGVIALGLLRLVGLSLARLRVVGVRARGHDGHDGGAPHHGRNRPRAHPEEEDSQRHSVEED
jgi:hypothetical protein